MATLDGLRRRRRRRLAAVDPPRPRAAPSAARPVAAHAVRGARRQLRRWRRPRPWLQPRLPRLLLQGRLRLLLEGRAKGAAFTGPALRRFLLPPMDPQAPLGPPHRRLPHLRIQAPPLFPPLRCSQVVVVFFSDSKKVES